MAGDREEIERLERRVAQLEALVATLLRESPARTMALRRPPREVSRPLPDAAPLPAPAPRAVARWGDDLEQWVGQRGLLVVGVLALLVAGGFFLKYAFDHHWIAPWLRVVGAIVAGVGLGVWGHRLIEREMRRYGAGIVAGGGGLVYLGIWAAAGPYALVERRLGIVLIAILTAAVAVLALHHGIEELAVLAVTGAWFAPIVLPDRSVQPELFFGYLEVVGLGAGILAYRQSWRRCFDATLLGYFWCGLALAWSSLAEPSGLGFVGVGGVAALLATAGRGWPEARVFGFAAAWLALVGQSAPDQSTGTRALAVAVATALAGTVWWQHRTVTSLSLPTSETLIFLASPLAFALIAPIHYPRPELLGAWPGLASAVIAAAYLTVGWPRRSVPHVALAFALLALAAALQWEGTRIVLAWSALALAATLCDRRLGQPGGTVVLPWLAPLAFVQLLTFAAREREPGGAFVDSWALALYLYVLAAALSAALSREAITRTALWVAAGAAVFCGISMELSRFFAEREPTWQSAGLAGDLALSAYWLLYAAVLVRIGFWLDSKAVRSAGLGVAGLAFLKVALYDLSELEALYRVGSFFALSLIALTVAYAYSRRGVAVAGGKPSDPGAP